MKQKFFLTKAKRIANQILYNFRLMLLFIICTLNGQKMKKDYFRVKITFLEHIQL